MLFSFGKRAEDPAERATQRSVRIPHRLSKLIAGVKNSVLSGSHTLIPALRLRIRIKEQQRARRSHQASVTMFGFTIPIPLVEQLRCKI
jgi:hypothetical protein